MRGKAGYRVAIHMKEYAERVPVVVIGGTAGDYLGEYMAGGILVVLGLDREEGEPLTGDFVGTGMHGGDIFLRGQIESHKLGKEVGVVETDDAAWGRLAGVLEAFRRECGDERLPELRRADFTRLRPVSHRPYGKIYVY